MTAQETALVDILAERMKQDLKWGKDRNLTPFFWLAILVEEVGEVAKAALEVRDNDIRKEAVHVAAVALAFIENLDRNQEVSNG